MTGTMVSVRWYPSWKTLEVRPRPLQVIARFRVVMVAVRPPVENRPGKRVYELVSSEVKRDITGLFPAASEVPESLTISWPPLGSPT